mmetsp:Transcript_8294/g.23294  ORF Transcript_8294/g.23294 Transcript_8294/m.23294 type:complete len:201 (+) Transcript_8294:545-1147(+)
MALHGPSSVGPSPWLQQPQPGSWTCAHCSFQSSPQAAHTGAAGPSGGIATCPRTGVLQPFGLASTRLATAGCSFVAASGCEEGPALGMFDGSRTTIRSRSHQLSTGRSVLTESEPMSTSGWRMTSSGGCLPTSHIQTRSVKWLQLLHTTSYVSLWKIGFSSVFMKWWKSSLCQSVKPTCTLRVGAPKEVSPGAPWTVSLA